MVASQKILVDGCLSTQPGATLWVQINTGTVYLFVTQWAVGIENFLQSRCPVTANIFLSEATRN